MIRDFINNHQFALKWLGIAFLIKLGLFVYFAINFYKNTPADLVSNFIFIYSGDTTGYYEPMDSFVNGTGYDSFCRMPGMLPIYYVLRLIFSAMWAKTWMIVLQFVTSTVSVYVLALIAKTVFKKDRVFYITFFLYAFSSFVSIWDHKGYADSFSTSFLIYSFYFLLISKSRRQNSNLLISSLFITWAVFIRPIVGIAIPLFVLFYLFDLKNLKQTFKTCFLFSLPIVFFLFLWAQRNYAQTGKIILLQGPLSECFPGLTPELLSIRDLVVSWGGDTQPWAKGSDGEWFFQKKTAAAEPESKGIYTAAYNLDSLIKLREIFLLTFKDSLPPAQKLDYKNYVNNKTKIYVESYRQEHAFKYYFLNKFVLVKRFVFPSRLDGLPFPKLSEMSLLQKMIKGGYLILLLLVSVFGLLGSFIAFYRKSFLPVIPLAFILILSVGMGYVEQRYFVPVYSFFVILSAVTVDWATTFSRNRRSQSKP
jgi:hypothetical protein